MIVSKILSSYLMKQKYFLWYTYIYRNILEIEMKFTYKERNRC